MADSSHNDSEVIAGLRLIRTDGIGPVTYHGLISKFGSATEAIRALPNYGQRLSRGKSLQLVEQSEIERELKTLTKLGGQIISINDGAYPRQLKETSDAPPFLSVLGNPAHLQKPSVSIVGARNASLNGKKLAHNLAKDLAEAAYTVWSGLARGIDTAAHEGAVSHSTVAVMAGGVDFIYPKQNQKLYDRIKEAGALVSEMAPGTEPQARHFPRRNRIISGAGLGVVVVEGTPKSGSLITARFALDQGREVFAVPGSPLDPRAQGPNSLIRDGAILVQSADDILREIEQSKQFMIEPLDAPSDLIQGIENIEEKDPQQMRDAVLDEIGTTPVTVDELRRQCQVSAPVLAAVLLDLELEGRLERLPGNRICGIGDV